MQNGIRASASGRFLLRIPPGLHAALREAAREASVSLNDYCSRRLALAGSDLESLPGAVAAIERAAALFGKDLVAVAAFGSWARGEAADASDVDLLVVVEPRVALTRRLYRAWDESAVVWDGHTVEPHFVHLPAPDRTVAGIWAEASLDGIVLFERGLRLSRRLAAIRGDIAEGRIVRRVVHGQPYWTEAA